MSNTNSTTIAGKVVVITGASSGLGEATARHRCAEGATVVLGARRAERIQMLADELKGQSGKTIARAVAFAHAANPTMWISMKSCSGPSARNFKEKQICQLCHR